jgi:hypothetical protein
MDFGLIERHPWFTTGAILIGGYILFSALRNRSAAASTGGITAVQTGPSDAQVQADAQAQQAAAQLQALQIQGSTQLQLAGVSADVAKTQITTGANSTDLQTAAGLQIGLSTLDAQLGLAQIQATSQDHLLDLLSKAFSGNSTPTAAASPVAVTGTTGNSVAAPVSTSNYVAPTPTTIAPPIYTPNPTGNGQSGDISAIIPGGQQLVPNFTVIPVGAWPDTNAVNANQQSQINWENATLNANAANNHAQCLSNAGLNKGYANYDSLVAACG